MLVLEGEKDVDAAWRHAVPATTNPEGAGKGKWKARYTSQLLASRIRQVFVIPDNDDAGRLHAREVLSSCRAGGIRTSLLLLPDVPEHGDLSDFFALGYTRRDLLRLVKKAARHGSDQ
jgi:DNA primase